MDNFEFVSPTKFVFGRDAEAKLPGELASRGATTVLLHYGGSSAVKSGLIGRIREGLAEAGIRVVECGGVRPNPEVGLAREAVELCRREGVDFIVAAGGGSVIDSAKAVAMAAPSDHDVWDFFSRKAVCERAIPIACVLTIPAAGSEASKNTVLSNDELGLKSGAGSDLVRPAVSFMNPELTFTLPAWQTAAGITDMYAHVLERYFCESPAVPVTDNMILGLMRTIVTEAPRVLEQPDGYDARANIMWAGMLCHSGIAGCGRHEDWATHGLEHELSAWDVTVTHGAGLAVLFPAWMRHVYRENPARFATYGREVFGIVTSGDVESDARRAIEATARFFGSIGMPGRLAEFGADEAAVEVMVANLANNRPEPFGSFKKLTYDDARAIYLDAL